MNTFFGSDCITSGRSSHHDVVNFINTYTVAMVSTVMLSICTSPFAVCMKLSSADNLFSGTLLLMPYRNEVVPHVPSVAFAKGTVSLAQAGTDVFLASLNIPYLCPFITGVASFRYEIDTSLHATGGGVP